MKPTKQQLNEVARANRDRRMNDRVIIDGRIIELHDTSWRKAMDSEDDLVRIDAEDARDELIVEASMAEVDAQRSRRSHQAIRRFRQGHRFFRLYNSKGPRVEVLSLEVRKGSAVVEGKRGVYAVAICDLRPSAQ